MFDDLDAVSFGRPGEPVHQASGVDAGGGAIPQPALDRGGVQPPTRGDRVEQRRLAGEPGRFELRDLMALVRGLHRRAGDPDHAALGEPAVDPLGGDDPADLVDGVDRRPRQRDTRTATVGRDRTLQSARQLADAPSAVAARRPEAHRVALDHQHPHARVGDDQRVRRPQSAVSGADDHHVDVPVPRQGRTGHGVARGLVVPQRVRRRRAVSMTPTVPQNVAAV